MASKKRDSVKEGDALFKEKGSVLTNLIRERYQSIVDGSLNSVLFIHLTSDKGSEISGHIDLTHRYTENLVKASVCQETQFHILIELCILCSRK